MPAGTLAQATKAGSRTRLSAANRKPAGHPEEAIARSAAAWWSRPADVTDALRERRIRRDELDPDPARWQRFDNPSKRAISSSCELETQFHRCAGGDADVCPRIDQTSRLAHVPNLSPKELARGRRHPFHETGAADSDTAPALWRRMIIRVVNRLLAHPSAGKFAPDGANQRCSICSSATRSQSFKTG